MSLSGTDDSGASGPVSARAEPQAEAPGHWNPRRSLGARLALYVLPVAIVPALVYWLAVDRTTNRDEERLLGTLLAEARRQEKESLRERAADRHREIADNAAKLVAILRNAASETARALEAGPDRELPAEALVDEPGGALRTARPGVSLAMVSRRTGLTPMARRDLAATRRLEAPFVALGLGPVDVSAIAVRTASGVLRVVPGRPLRVNGKDVVSPDFPFPSGEDLARAAQRTEPGEDVPVVWSDVYEDLYSTRGSVVTAMTLVRGNDGRPVAEVGVDWSFTRLFEEPPDPDRPEDVELLVSDDGRVLVAAPSRLIPPEEAKSVAAAVRDRPDGLFEPVGAASRYQGATLRLPDLRWNYVKLAPRAALETRLRQTVEPILSAGRRRRIELRLAYLVVLAGLSAILVVVTRRAVDPVRRVAHVADALALGSSPGHVPGLDRGDEVGRLFRAIKNLDRRVRWRMASMEGVHGLAQTAALMTRPDETMTQLARQIAQLVGAAKAWFVLWDPDARALIGAPPGYGIPEDALVGIRVGLDELTLAMIVYRTGETAHGNDLNDPRLSLKFVKRLDVRQNYVLAPLRAESGTLGVLGVADKPGGFDAEDRAAIEGYADQAALLLRNARLYEELQKSYERLRNAQRNRDYFLQNVNHELRTPLTAILGWSEVLAEDRPDKETVKIAVDQINRSAQFLLALISDLLDLSRFEEGRTRLEPEEVDLGSLVAGAVEPVSVMAEAKGIEMSVETPSKGTLVRLDPMRMRQVLWNLVHNAVKFTPKGGRIRVEASADDGGASFSVVDNGVGVDAKDLPFIFERFRQVDGSATRAYRGMGIGLALAKAYVELHGGTIAVESQPGKGTAFHVRLPRIGPSAEIGAHPAPA